MWLLEGRLTGYTRIDYRNSHVTASKCAKCAKWLQYRGKEKKQPRHREMRIQTLCTHACCCACSIMLLASYDAATTSPPIPRLQMAVLFGDELHLCCTAAW
jgi:hypothetical protein